MEQSPNGSEPSHAGNREGHPLGPLIRRERFTKPLIGRAAAGVLCLSCVTVLAVAVWVTPNPRGFGTHKKLGLAPCGFLVRTGFPCPTCGMTTSFSYTVRGRFGAAFHAQPLGAILAVAAALFAIGFAAIALSGKTWVVNWYRVPPLRVVLGAGLTFILAWGIKIAWGLLDGSLPARTG